MLLNITGENSSVNMESKRFVFWMNIPSIHMAPWIKALADNPDHEVLIVVSNEVPTHEKERGWGEVDYGKARLVVENRWPELFKIVQNSRNYDVQVFAGLGAYPIITKILQSVLIAEHGHIAIFSESLDPRGIKKIPRKLKLFLHRNLAKQVDTFFLTNDLAIQQFKEIGVPTSKFAKFGYFVDSAENNRNVPENRMNIIYVGSLIPRKNVKVLALALLKSNVPCNLTILGKGPQFKKIKKLISQKATEIHLTEISAVENREIGDIISGHDLLVLPSLYDGWGATTNEALMVGTRVVVSKFAGSSDLVTSEFQGRTFDPRSVQELAEILIEESEAAPMWRSLRKELVEWSNSHISPKIVSQYFELAVFRKSNCGIPDAPWNQN